MYSLKLKTKTKTKTISYENGMSILCVCYELEQSTTNLFFTFYLKHKS